MFFVGQYVRLVGVLTTEGNCGKIITVLENAVIIKMMGGMQLQLSNMQVVAIKDLRLILQLTNREKK